MFYSYNTRIKLMTGTYTVSVQREIMIRLHVRNIKYLDPGPVCYNNILSYYEK